MAMVLITFNVDKVFSIIVIKTESNVPQIEC